MQPEAAFLPPSTAVHRVWDKRALVSDDEASVYLFSGEHRRVEQGRTSVMRDRVDGNGRVKDLRHGDVVGSGLYVSGLETSNERRRGRA
jgi:hypothetical protein